MFKLIQQKGSSSVGLLTASAIYIGLLVYANQFAFSNSDNSFLSSFTSQSPDNVAVPSLEAESSVDTGTIQPSSQGIFATPTLTSQDLNEADSSLQSADITKQNPAPSTDVVFVAKQLMLTGKDETQPYVANQMVNQGYAGQTALTSYQYQNAGFNNNQQYYSTTRANGRGNGRGKMNSDGAFNFSMSFKARGRMDADSDFDGNLVTDGNAYQHHLYNTNIVSNPAYRYSYYNY